MIHYGHFTEGLCLFDFISVAPINRACLFINLDSCLGLCLSLLRRLNDTTVICKDSLTLLFFKVLDTVSTVLVTTHLFCLWIWLEGMFAHLICEWIGSNLCSNKKMQSKVIFSCSSHVQLYGAFPHHMNFHFNSNTVAYIITEQVCISRFIMSV